MGWAPARLELRPAFLWLGMYPSAVPQSGRGMLLCSSPMPREETSQTREELGSSPTSRPENNEERECSVSSPKPGYPRQRQHKHSRDSPVQPCQGHPFCAQRVFLMGNLCWLTWRPDKPGIAPCNLLQLQPVSEEVSGTPFPRRPSVFPDS